MSMGTLVHEHLGSWRRLTTTPSADLGGLIKRAVAPGSLCYWWSTTVPKFDAVDFSQGFAATDDSVTNLANCTNCNATVNPADVLTYV